MDDVLAASRGVEVEAAASRHDRPELISFIDDAATETALREGLADLVSGAMDIRRGGVRAATAALRKATTPRVLIIDVSSVEQPLTALGELALVTEPDVRVLVVGTIESLDFYREITRGLGAHEYLHKPLTRDRVARHFGPLLANTAPVAEAAIGGAVITITGVRGGVGATTIAVNLAWHFGVLSSRHTVLLDPDLYGGSAALMLDAQTGPGLRTALETPERIDELFVERAAQPVADRLHVLAGEVKLTERPVYGKNAAPLLIAALKRRYSFVVCDLPFGPMDLNRDLFALATQRVLVMVPTLGSVRDVLRMLAIPADGTARKPVIVLNRLGMPGGLPRKRIEEALKTKVDIVVPDLPRQVEAAATMGEAVSARRNGMRAGIVELARLTGAARLLDGARPSDQPVVARRGGLFGLFGR